ncbi:MAG: metallophosphoesterase [Peptococcaceae bacterium]|jgi:Icc-related predicted phosphoesterase|nr:metallophosphoesterase [Peptococcaceae bacterium]
MKFLACSDLEGKHMLIEILAKADLSKYDFLLYKGDTPDPSVYKKLRTKRTLEGEEWAKKTSTSLMEEASVQEAMRKAVEDSTRINDLFGEIAKKLPIYGVLGNSDTVPTQIAPKLGLKAVDFSEHIDIIHKRAIKIGEYDFVGYNGRPQYKDEATIEAPDLYFAEETARQDLHALFKTVNPAKTIFVTHAPAYGYIDQVCAEWVPYGVATYGEKAKDGHIGCDAFREIIDTYHPLLHTFGHVHETPGVEKQGRTTIFNGGALGETGEIEEITVEGDQVTCGWIKLWDL